MLSKELDNPMYNINLSFTDLKPYDFASSFNANIHPPVQPFNQKNKHYPPYLTTNTTHYINILRRISIQRPPPIRDNVWRHSHWTTTREGTPPPPLHLGYKNLFYPLPKTNQVGPNLNCFHTEVLSCHIKTRTRWNIALYLHCIISHCFLQYRLPNQQYNRPGVFHNVCMSVQ